MRKFSNSYELVKESFKVLKQEKQLLWFPVLSGISTMLLFISFLVTFFVFDFSEEVFEVVYYIFLFCFYLLNYFIVIFFNTGLITCAHMKLNGQNPKLRDGINNAFKNIGKIFIWSLISATVGLILNLISNKTKNFGKIVTSLIGMVWTLLTFFVIPVMIFENKSVIKSISGSGQLFKKTWGENVIADVTMGFFFFILGLLGLVPLFISFFIGNVFIILIVAVLIIIYWVILAIVSSSLKGIFIVTLYNYAKTGKIPLVFKQEIIRGAFKPE